MQNHIKNLISTVIIAVSLGSAQVLHADTLSFGGPDNVAYAEKLWQAMEGINLVGSTAKPDKPYKGTHPHGAVLEVLFGTLTVNDHEGEIIVKRNYGGTGVSIDTVTNDRDKFLKDLTIMFKREKDYDDENQDWFWAKYKIDGSLEANPRGKKLAGRVAKGKPKGCIACHKSAPGGDYLFVK